MAIRSLDELNNISTPPEEYFGDMDLSEQQKKDRIKYTYEAYDAILFAMALIDTYRDYGKVDYDYVKRQLEDRIAAIIAGFTVLDDYLLQYSSDFAQNFVDSTEKHIGEEWYISEDRSLFDAENSANDTQNYIDYINALKNGMTHKEWRTERDNKVRGTHRMVDRKVLPITEYFVVGEALMRFPKDEELAFDYPKELINCRCTMKYIKK